MRFVCFPIVSLVAEIFPFMVISKSVDASNLFDCSAQFEFVAPAALTGLFKLQGSNYPATGQSPPNLNVPTTNPNLPVWNDVPGSTVAISASTVSTIIPRKVNGYRFLRAVVIITQNNPTKMSVNFFAQGR